jgi:hypothetical protein
MSFKGRRLLVAGLKINSHPKDNCSGAPEGIRNISASLQPKRRKFSKDQTGMRVRTTTHPVLF